MKILLLSFVFCFSNIALAQVHNGARSPAGTWNVEGLDESRTYWKAKLVLMPKDPEEYPPKNFEGYFDWRGSNNTGGREFIVAIFDYDTSVLKMKGTELQEADPNIKATIYASVMNEKDNSLLEDGIWKSCGVCPGKWTAKRINDKPIVDNKKGPKRKQQPRLNCNDGVCKIEDLNDVDLISSSPQ
jgi:hypothetical protein